MSGIHELTHAALADVAANFHLPRRALCARGYRFWLCGSGLENVAGKRCARDCQTSKTRVRAELDIRTLIDDVNRINSIRKSSIRFVKTKQVIARTRRQVLS